MGQDNKDNTPQQTIRSRGKFVIIDAKLSTLKGSYSEQNKWLILN